MLLRHPISRRGFLLGTSLAVSQVLPQPAKSSPPRPDPDYVPAEVTIQSSVEDFGVTWHFNEPQPVVYSCLGEPCVLLQPGAQITHTSHPSEEISGGWSRGIVKNPWGRAQDNSDRMQGWDPRYGTMSSTTNRVPYDASLNIDPVKTGDPIALEEATYVKALRDPQGTGQSHVSAYSYLTVLTEHPPAGFFRPHAVSLSKTVQWREEQINYNVLRSFAPTSGMPSWNSAERQVAPRIFRNGWGGQRLRTLATEQLPDYTNRSQGSTYNAQQGVARAEAYFRMHTDAPQSQKRTLMLRLIQDGLDRIAEFDRGFAQARGEGQWHGYIFSCYLAAFALGSQEVLKKAQSIRSNLTDQCGFFRTNIGHTPGWPTGGSGDQRRFNSWIAPEFQDWPWMATNGRPNNSNRGMGSTTWVRYLPTAVGANAAELAPILFLQNGPGGISGLDAWLNSRVGNGQMDETNDMFAAIWWLMDLYPLWRNMPSANNLSSWATDFYTTYRDEIAAPRPLHLPPMKYDRHRATNLPEIVSAINGGFSWSINATKWALPERPVTRQDIRYSQDGVQFIELHDVQSNDEVTGLTVSQHLVQVRNWNVNGHMGWSDNFNYSETSWDDPARQRNAVTPTGSPANAAPVQVVAPKLYTSRVPTTTQPDYIEAPSPLGSDQFVIIAGAGYFSGHPAPQREYRKKRNGVVVGDWQESPRFTLEPDDVGERVSVEIRIYNREGEVFVETNEAEYPERLPLPEGVHFESTFDASFALWYPEVSVAAESGSLSFEPNSSFSWAIVPPPEGLEWDGDGEDEDDYDEDGVPVGVRSGSLRVRKDGTRPHMVFNDMAARKPLEPGKTYRLEMYMPVDFSSGSLRVTLGSGAKYNPGGSPEVFPRDPRRILHYTRDFTVAQNETDLRLSVEIRNTTSTGWGAGGDPRISWARLTEIREA